MHTGTSGTAGAATSSTPASAAPTPAPTPTAADPETVTPTAPEPVAVEDPAPASTLDNHSAHPARATVKVPKHIAAAVVAPKPTEPREVRRPDIRRNHGAVMVAACGGGCRASRAVGAGWRIRIAGRRRVTTRTGDGAAKCRVDGAGSAARPWSTRRNARDVGAAGSDAAPVRGVLRNPWPPTICWRTTAETVEPAVGVAPLAADTAQTGEPVVALADLAAAASPELVGDGSVATQSSPSGVAISGNRAYVTNRGAGTVSVIDLASKTVIATVTVGAAPSAVAVKPDGTRAYVTNGGAGTVSVIDTTTNTVVSTIKVGTNPSDIALSPDGTRASSPTPAPTASPRSTPAPTKSSSATPSPAPRPSPSAPTANTATSPTRPATPSR